MKRLIEYFLYPDEQRRELVRIHPYWLIENKREAYYHCFGLLVNWRAQWVGWHYSPAHKRLCVNLLPGVTLWWAKPGGQLP